MDNQNEIEDWFRKELKVSKEEWNLLIKKLKEKLWK